LKPARRIILGAAIAIVLAFTVAVPTIRGISTWKYLLAAIGVMLFLAAGRDRSTKA
jgi:hypothetical protein